MPSLEPKTDWRVTLVVSLLAAATFLFCAAQSARVVMAMHDRVAACESTEEESAS